MIFKIGYYISINVSGNWPFAIFSQKIFITFLIYRKNNNIFVYMFVRNKKVLTYIKSFVLNNREKISDSVLSKLVDAGAFDSLYSNRKALKMSIPNAIQYANTVKSQEGKLLNNFGMEYVIPEVIDDPIERLENLFFLLLLQLFHKFLIKCYRPIMP